MILHVDFVGTAFLAVIAAAIFEGANQFLLLCTMEITGLTAAWGRHAVCARTARSVGVMALPGLAVTCRRLFPESPKLGDVLIRALVNISAQVETPASHGFRNTNHQRSHRIALVAGSTTAADFSSRWLVNQGWTPPPRAPPAITGQRAWLGPILQFPHQCAVAQPPSMGRGGDPPSPAVWGLRRRQRRRERSFRSRFNAV